MLLEQELTRKIIKCAIEVHKALGPGLLELSYEKCLMKEFELSDVLFKSQIELPLEYKRVRIDAGYLIDLIVEQKVIIELKAVGSLIPVQEAQLLTYMKLTGIRVGMLMNFNVPVLKDGIKRMVL
ncbi:MAG: GxxExxY protein [Candidatus Marinimicrobia bacterium]|jgi:GxxExxY protein|nr:GxxExxY protein [Candidatus Neomarinimicrobiota bacterium]MBT3945166.1 GxxExxY protein [Candidatus Neomarinimicrobiota bacterium]MBT4154738.1 GxxExxY protein [Candidatus Neomarinimicrobiota bacterium]MBT4555070.1 GxxExxY protein [Candidatus Neomarinimicrobiota bacterium]MBT4752855.1 GxxExxY protein [Candidatus Neomarinimicrobiota bacterium]|tara:strand:- start:1293 stop:1667 length:375 start_codon:yes stop_codon:yes gene_type:complete